MEIGPEREASRATARAAAAARAGARPESKGAASQPFRRPKAFEIYVGISHPGVTFRDDRCLLYEPHLFTLALALPARAHISVVDYLYPPVLGHQYAACQLFLL